MKGNCEDCARKDYCKKSMGFMMGYCNTDFEPAAPEQPESPAALNSDTIEYALQVVEAQRAHAAAQNSGQKQQGYYDGMRTMLEIILTNGYTSPLPEKCRATLYT